MRLAILISGRGSNMSCLADAITSYELAADIVLVAANKPCAGLDEAMRRGLPTTLVSRADFGSREDHEQALIYEIERSGADLVFLAGYMAILSPAFVARFAGRIINIHPSLLPAFKGLDTHQRALDSGAVHHGVTVHIVTPDLDDGPICLQAGLTVEKGLTVEALASQVLKLEHALYPFILYALCRRTLTVANGLPVWHEPTDTLSSAPTPIKSVLETTVIWPALDKNSN